MNIIYKNLAQKTRFIGENVKNNLFLLKYLLLQGKKDGKDEAVARFTGKTRITRDHRNTGKTKE